MNTTSSTQVSSEEEKEEPLFNISECDFDQFQIFMSKQYGQVNFTRGFNIIMQNRNGMGEEIDYPKIEQKLKCVQFENSDQLDQFII